MRVIIEKIMRSCQSGQLIMLLKQLTDFNQLLNVLLFWVCQPVLHLRACMPIW